MQIKHSSSEKGKLRSGQETQKDNDEKKKAFGADTRIKGVYSVWGPAEAEVIKSFLESHGIQSILKGLVVQSVHPFSADGLGEIKIFVLEEDYELAKKLITKKVNSPLTPDQEDWILNRLERLKN